ncbi:hypothetical protein B0H21DRAFT_731152, partial [Amylocystis lapponica]
LYDRIIDYLHDDLNALAACSLTSRLWLPTARYHRFQSSRMDWHASRLFHEILLAAPELGRFVTTLELCSPHSMSTLWRDEGCPFLGCLPVVVEIKITGMGIRGKIVRDLVEQLNTVKRLALSRCRVDTTDDLITLVSSFPLLEEFSLRECIPPSPPTATLEIVTPLHSSCAWPTLKHLELRNAPASALSCILDGNALALADCTELRTCKLYFDFYEMCVPENQSLPWVELTLAIRIDDMVDIRSLGSECTVRVVTHAHFDDLRVLDWRGIEGYSRSQF